MENTFCIRRAFSVFHVEQHPGSAIAAAWARARDKNNVLGLGQYSRDVPCRLQTPVWFSLVEFSLVELSLVYHFMSHAASRRQFGLVQRMCF